MVHEQEGTIMVKFAVTKEMDQEEWEDHVLGSGAFGWSWWKQVAREGDGIRVWWYTDVDNSEDTDHDWMSWQDLADAASRLARVNGFVANQLTNDDFDADGMDQVLQFAFMGEVIYG